MRSLIPLAPPTAEEFDLHAHYALDWVDGGGLRANFVASVDGAATADGRSRGLQTAGDNRVFAALRDLADVVLVGAGTARDEGYRPARISPERAAIREQHGFARELPVAVVSRALRLDVTSSLFAPGAAPRPIVLTCTASDASVRAELEQVADVIVCGDLAVDLAAARSALEKRGLTRILLEGGPHLYSEMAEAGTVDELCLSISPLLTGPGSARITAGLPWTDGAIDLELTGLLEEDGSLFCRYRVGAAQ